MADRPNFAQDRQLRRRLQQSVHCGAARYRHADQRNESYQFLPRDSYAKRGICRRRMSVCLSVCLSVCVCLSHSGIVSKRLNVGSRK